MLAETWAEFWTEIWNTEIWSWNSLIAAGFVVLIGLFFNAFNR